MHIDEAAHPVQGGPPLAYGLPNRAGRLGEDRFPNWVGRLGEDRFPNWVGRLGEGGRSQPPAAVERSLACEGATGEGLDAEQGCDVAA